MLTIADEFARQGLDATKSSLRVGIFGAEPWSESLRTEIETRFHMDAVDIYGLSEVMGPGVASECVETKDGLIIWRTISTLKSLIQRQGRSCRTELTVSWCCRL